MFTTKASAIARLWMGLFLTAAMLLSGYAHGVDSHDAVHSCHPDLHQDFDSDHPDSRQRDSGHDASSHCHGAHCLFVIPRSRADIGLPAPSDSPTPARYVSRLVSATLGEDLDPPRV